MQPVRVRGQELEIAEPFANAVREASERLEAALVRVRELDPNWIPLPSLRNPGPTIDVGALIRGLRSEAQEAEGRITVVERGGVPLGFNSREQYREFGQTAWRELSSTGYKDVTVYLRGSSVTGHSYETGRAFDAGRQSDYDLAIVSRELFQQAREMGVRMRTGESRTVVLRSSDRVARELKLDRLLQSLEDASGREVTVVIHSSLDALKARGPYLPID
jgi:filamentous hemagglutinin